MISRAINTVLGSYVDKSGIPSRIEKYGDILNQISSIQADKKVKAAELADFYKAVLRDLKGDYDFLKKQKTYTLFEAVEDDELEELLDLTPNINLNLSGGTGNDVDVL
jgi:hypothetical protein